MITTPESAVASRLSTSARPVCRACASDCARTIVATERMLGLGGEFNYGQCERCGSLSLASVPADLGRYYPATSYYSFSTPKAAGHASLRDKLSALFAKLAGIRSIDTRLIQSLYPDRNAHILDVGSGAGQKLETLWHVGYRNLCGIDRFLPAALERDKPFPLKGCSVSETGSDWDLIMYHHVLEHIADPVAEIAAAARSLAPGGRLLIRIPVADSWAFHHYGRNWVQLDAPRHLCLLSRRALSKIAADHGLSPEKLFDDSTSFQLWASRIYVRSTRSFLTGDNPYIRNWRVMLRWLPALVFQSLVAFCLNMSRRGDQSCFVFRKI